MVSSPAAVRSNYHRCDTNRKFRRGERHWVTGSWRKRQSLAQLDHCSCNPMCKKKQNNNNKKNAALVRAGVRGGKITQRITTCTRSQADILLSLSNVVYLAGWSMHQMLTAVKSYRSLGTLLVLLMEMCPIEWSVSSAACVSGFFLHV